MCVYNYAAGDLWGINPTNYDDSQSLGVSFRNNGVYNPSVTVQMYWRARNGNNEIGTRTWDAATASVAPRSSLSNR